MIEDTATSQVTHLSFSLRPNGIYVVFLLRPIRSFIFCLLAKRMFNAHPRKSLSDCFSGPGRAVCPLFVPEITFELDNLRSGC